MKEVWRLPEVSSLNGMDNEWVLKLLDGLSELERMRILMTLWRIWHVRNEIVHDKPTPPMESSGSFLCSYVESLTTIKYCLGADDVKGKHPVAEQLEGCLQPRKTKPVIVDAASSWSKPVAGTVKLNVDGSFSEATGSGGAGMVLRDDTGAVIVSACRYIPSCSSPLEAELVACREGVALARQWSNKSCTMEVDSREAVKMINSLEMDRSSLAFTVQDIKDLPKLDPRFQAVAIDRFNNQASHLLANLGRSKARTITWVGTGPNDVLSICLHEASTVA
ncbi:hypothetical protein ACQ4PT_004995 [Festuca glaucescens]